MKRSLRAALPSVDSLIVFEQAAHYLSFTKAGQHLGLTQSAVSRQIIDLESLLKVPLFIRDKKQLKLTPQALEFREMMLPVLQGLTRATQTMQNRSAMAETLSISVAASFCSQWFIPHLPHYRAQADDTRFNITPHVGKMSLQSHGVDALILNAEHPPEHCRFIKLADIEVAPFAARSWLAAQHKTCLEDFTCIPALELVDGNPCGLGICRILACRLRGWIAWGRSLCCN